jgi:hypothetical protein
MAATDQYFNLLKKFSYLPDQAAFSSTTRLNNRFLIGKCHPKVQPVICSTPIGEGPHHRLTRLAGFG